MRILEYIINLDYSFFFFINSTLSNPIFDWIMPLFDDTKNWILIIIALWLCLAYSNKKYRLHILILIPIIILFCDQIGGFIKDFHLRNRPWVDLSPDMIRHLVAPRGAALSFPSNHASNISGVAYFFSKVFPSYKLYFWMFAIIIMFSRIYIGVHYPIDIIAGFVLGVLISKSIINVGNYISNENNKI